MAFKDSLPRGDRDDLDDDLELDDEELLENAPVIRETKTETPKTPKHRNLVVKQIAKNKQKGMIINVVGIEVPRAFDFDYYQEKISELNAKKEKSSAYRMHCFKKYAEVVYEFYRQVMYYFNTKHNIIDMPEYIKNSEKAQCNLTDLADMLYAREQNLLRAYDGNDSKLLSTIAKSKHMSEVKEFAAQAWLMYTSLTQLNDFVGYLKYIQECYNSADLDNQSHIANIYGLNIQANYYVDANINNFFSISRNGLFMKKRPLSARLYQDIDANKSFDLLVSGVGGYVVADHQDVPKLKEKVDEDSIEYRIIGFYDHYRDMKYVKHKLRVIAKRPIEEAKNDIFIFYDNYHVEEEKKNRDMYIVAMRYYKACKSLITQIPVRSKIYKDVVEMFEDLERVLVDCEDLYKHFMEENKKYEEYQASKQSDGLKN